MAGARPRVLFVCVGNACRSPMAEVLAREIGGGGWEVESAGTSHAGWVSPEVAEALGEIGLEADDLRSKGLREVEPASFDIVVILSDASPGSVVPETYEGRVELWPLRDPVGGPIEEYRRVRDELLPRIEELAREVLVS